MKNVAAQGMTLMPEETDVVIAGAVVTTPASTTTKADGKGLYSGDISVTVATVVYNGYTASGLVFTLHPSAEYASVDGKKALLEGDNSDTVTATGYMPPSQTTTFNVTLKVVAAGQTSVSAE